MNQYNNTAGYHNPKFTESVLNKMNKDTFLDWTDSSWHNDTCDSIYNEDHDIYVFIPNCMKPDNKLDADEWNTFNLYLGYGESEPLLMAKNIDEIIKHINERE